MFFEGRRADSSGGASFGMLAGFLAGEEEEEAAAAATTDAGGGVGGGTGE